MTVIKSSANAPSRAVVKPDDDDHADQWRGEHNGEMKIEILHIDECPSWIEAGSRLQEALSLTGNEGADIVYRLLRTPEDAARVPFAGSPTMTCDDEDLFPTDGRTTDMACRIYFTPTGLAGLPTTEQLVEAITSRGR